MLQSLLAYARGAGVDARWLTIGGSEAFFEVTKRLHNRLHGAPGDGGELGKAEHLIYESALQESATELTSLLREGDVVYLHDPQTAGIAPHIKARGINVVWRCHVGLDHPNELAREAWSFLSRYIQEADAYVFSREAFAWEGLERDKIWVVPPSIDAFSPKNQEMDIGHGQGDHGHRSDLRRTAARRRYLSATTGVVAGSTGRPSSTRRVPSRQGCRWSPRCLAGIGSRIQSESFSALPRISATQRPICCLRAPRWRRSPTIRRERRSSRRFATAGRSPAGDREPDPPRLSTDGRRRGERCDGQRDPAQCGRRSPEEPRGGIRPDGRGGDVEVPPGGCRPHRRNPGSDRRRGFRVPRG